MFYDRIRKEWTFNTGDCLIEVTTWAGLTVIFNMESDNLNTSSLIRRAAILVIMSVSTFKTTDILHIKNPLTL